MSPLARSLVADLVRAALAGDRPTFDVLFELGFTAVWIESASGQDVRQAEAATRERLKSAVEECLRADPPAALPEEPALDVRP